MRIVKGRERERGRGGGRGEDEGGKTVVIQKDGWTVMTRERVDR